MGKLIASKRDVRDHHWSLSVLARSDQNKFGTLFLSREHDQNAVFLYPNKLFSFRVLNPILLSIYLLMNVYVCIFFYCIYLLTK